MKSINFKKQQQIIRRKHRSRAKISQTSRVRLSVFRSLKHLSAQIIDDQKRTTLVAVHDREITDAKVKGLERARQLGLLLATKAKAKKIEQVVFDKGSYRYHGQIKSLAEGAREGGLQF